MSNSAKLSAKNQSNNNQFGQSFLSKDRLNQDPKLSIGPDFSGHNLHQNTVNLADSPVQRQDEENV